MYFSDAFLFHGGHLYDLLSLNVKKLIITIITSFDT